MGALSLIGAAVAADLRLDLAEELADPADGARADARGLFSSVLTQEGTSFNLFFGLCSHGRPPTTTDGA